MFTLFDVVEFADGGKDYPGDSARMLERRRQQLDGNNLARVRPGYFQRRS